MRLTVFAYAAARHALSGLLNGQQVFAREIKWEQAAGVWTLDPLVCLGQLNDLNGRVLAMLKL